MDNLSGCPFQSHVNSVSSVDGGEFVSAFLTKFVFVCFSPHGGHSTAGDFDSEVDSTVSSRRGSRRREKHSINRNEGM